MIMTNVHLASGPHKWPIPLYLANLWTQIGPTCAPFGTSVTLLTLNEICAGAMVMTTNHLLHQWSQPCLAMMPDSQSGSVHRQTNRADYLALMHPCPQCSTHTHPHTHTDGGEESIKITPNKVCSLRVVLILTVNFQSFAVSWKLMKKLRYRTWPQTQTLGYQCNHKDVTRTWNLFLTALDLIP